MVSRLLKIGFGVLALLTSASTLAQLSWLGNTQTANMGSPIPSKGAYMLPNGSVTVTTQTFPIATGQNVTAIVTTDNWVTTQEVSFNFDRNVGNNTQWYGIIGPYAKGTNVQFYLRARGTGVADLFDNNGGQNFGYTWRYSPTTRRGAILQWFATDYNTILKRLPEVVQAGYGALYLPPPAKSGGGGFSTGYNPVDRFDLGDRLLMGTVKTRYGTTEELINLIRTAKRFGLEVYCDLVTNHNDNRASWQMNRYPDLIPEDFHIRSSSDTTNSEINFNSAGPLSYEMLNHDLVGLADIAHENGNQTLGGTPLLPAYAQLNIWGKPWFTRHPKTPQYYSGGNIVKEDVREYLKRNCWYLMNVVGFDGFRIDAVKHTNPSFFMKTIGQAGYDSHNADLLPYLYSFNPNAMIFGEVLSGNNWELREYAKTGMNVLDFPLVFNLRSVFNGGGFGDIGSLSNGFGIDAATGLGFQNGGVDPNVGVAFVQSHDDGPPQSNNLAHAFVLTRPGSAKVYYDGNNQNPSDYNQFPKPGRFDAVGNAGNTTTRMTDARYRFGRGTIFNRFQSSDLYVYERHVSGQSVLLVGLNDRGDTSLTQTVTTAFTSGTELEDLTGQQPNVVVNGSNQVTITIPSNSAVGNSNNATGYVMYAPVTAKPDGVAVVVSNTSGSEFTENTIASPIGTFATSSGTTWKAATVNTNTLNISINTTSVGHEAFVMLDNGSNGPIYSVLQNTAEGLKDGFMTTTKLSNGRFQLNNLDVSRLSDGLHMLRARVFNNTGTGPQVFNDFYYWFYLQRGLGTNWTIDGNLAEFGTQANWWQERTASSGANRLDGLFVSNDDQYLYVGVAGRVDATENLTNGMCVVIDSEVGGSGGLTSLTGINDDSGPATRLLSNTNLALPIGFKAKYLLSSFRNKGLSSSPEASVSGSPMLPSSVGAQSGAWWINSSALTRLSGIPSSIAVQPRPGITGPILGMEAAIPLRQLYASNVSGYQPLGFLAFLGTTGEAGTTLLASDPLRETLGGYPAAQSWVSNQFLPTQTGIVNDPGTAGVSLNRYLTYWPKRAQFMNAVRATSEPVVRGTVGNSTQLVRVTNTGSTTVNGPIWLRIALSPRDFTNVVNKRGETVFGGRNAYVQVQPGSLGPGASATFTVQFNGAKAWEVQATYTALVGEGAL